MVQRGSDLEALHPSPGKVYADFRVGIQNMKRPVLLSSASTRLGLALLSAALVMPLALGCAQVSTQSTATSGGSTATGSGGSTTGATPCNLTCASNQVCHLESGEPTCVCAAGYELCEAPGGDVCTIVAQDSQNCGECENACLPGEVCSDGGCICSFTLCPGPDGGEVCADLQSDPANCNACNYQCTRGNDCIDGTCQCTSSSPSCSADAGLICCDNYCQGTVPLDPFNCGGCGNVCVSGACILGDAGTPVCDCPPPYMQCGPDCIGPSEREGIVFCETDGQLQCTFIDPYGANACRNQETNGCGCDGPPGPFLACCPGRLGCTVTGDDAFNCGACGNVCDSGICQLTDAGGVCAPLHQDD